MKKLLTGIIVFTFLCFTIAIFQSSCSKTTAQNPNTITQVGKIVYEKYSSTGSEIWLANFDGSNATQIPITYPANVQLDFSSVASSLSTSPDGQTVFFTCTNTGGTFLVNEIYSCSINGGNATLVIPTAAGSTAIGQIHAF